MDIDAFVAARQAGWQRLADLTKAARRTSTITPADVDELVALYEHTGSDLAHARIAFSADDALVNRLTFLVAEAHGVLYSQREREVARSLHRFVTVTFPLAMYDIRKFILAAALLTFVPWAAMQIWIGISPQAFDLTAPDAVREQYIEQDFEEYYSSQPAQNFTTQVFLNNVRVGILAFASGVFVCVITAALLVYNGLNVGIAGGLFTHVGQWERFWGLILPHGMLELSAVVVAGAAGLRLGWAVIDPGELTRWEALTIAGRRAGSVLVGLVAAFLIAALIEGFVSGRPWPTSVRVMIGLVAFLGFWGTTFVLAVRAHGARSAEAAEHQALLAVS